MEQLPKVLSKGLIFPLFAPVSLNAVWGNRGAFYIVLF